MITLRRAHSADAPVLAALAEATFRETFAADNSDEAMDVHCSGSFGPQRQLAEISDPLRVTIVAEAGASMIGFAQLRLRRPAPCFNSERPCELNRIYVCGEWHGRRVAHQLMREVLSTAAQTNALHVWLGVWERNRRAIAFYRKFGFEVVGEHSFVLGREPQRDIIMLAPVDAASSSP